jgi:hypothetical protein
MGGIEVIDAIEAWGFGEGFNRGDAIKYIARAGRKNPETEIEDLQKAKWYIERELRRVRNEDENAPDETGVMARIAGYLETYAKAAAIGDGTSCVCLTEIVREAVVALDACSQIAWERDVAIEQLRSIGKELGEQMDDVRALIGEFDSHCGPDYCEIPTKD